MVSRREFLKVSAATGLAAYLATRAKYLITAYGQVIQQIPLPASAIPQFVDPLPLLSVQGGSLATIVAGAGEITLSMQEFEANVLPTGTFAPGVKPKTWVWGYIQGTGAPSGPQDTYLGPVVVATRGQPTQMRFVNNLGFANPYDDPNLPEGTRVIAYYQSSDQTLHWADPLHDGENHFGHMAMPPAFGTEAAKSYTGPIPAVVHIHGGEVPPVLDGGPDAWYTSDGSHHGAGYYTHPGVPAALNESVYRYPNAQEAAPIWFHDHTLGATRLNVYAGMAGGWVIYDDAHQPAGDLGGLAGAAKIIPLILQDRTFDTNGQFFLPAANYGGLQQAPNPEHPYWVPEFVGNTILVNGKAWPFLEVQPAKHRFLFVNGSNARTYEMFLTDPKTKVNGPPMWVIGTDGGYLDHPVKIDPNAPKGQPQRLVIMPGERYEVIVDFSDPAWLALNPNFSGTLILKNVGKTPFPGGETPAGNSLGQMMQFRVTTAATAPTVDFAPTSAASIRSNPIPRLVDPVAGALAVTPDKTRLLTLNEVMGMPQIAENPVDGSLTAFPGGPLEILVNNTKWSGKRITGVEEMDDELMYTMEPIPGFVPDASGNYLSELPVEGDTELWEIVNLTADAHPIHTHLVTFQLVNRQNFDVKKYDAAYGAAFPGGGWDSMACQSYPAGVYIPGFGPPDAYAAGDNPLSGGKDGGNPDVAGFLKGPVNPPQPQEAGWKDTVVVYPGQVTRLAVRWAPNDTPVGTRGQYPFDPAVNGAGYVWHCHIIDHEDNEMMRPDRVVPDPNATRTYVQGVDY